MHGTRAIRRRRLRCNNSGCAVPGTPSACAQVSRSQRQGEHMSRKHFAAICSAAAAVSLFAVAPPAQGTAASSSSPTQSTTANSGGPGSDQTGTVPTTLPTVRCTPVAGNSPSAIASAIGSQESSGSAGATGTTGIGDAKAIGTNVGIPAGTPTDSSNAVAISKRSAMMTTGGVPCVPGTGPGATTNPPLTPLTPVTPVPTGTSDAPGTVRTPNATRKLGPSGMTASRALGSPGRTESPAAPAYPQGYGA
jgi:hypothetical protein